jgi:hypothetical protein
MKSVPAVILLTFFAAVVPAAAEYATGDFIDGLQYMQAVFNAGSGAAAAKVPKPANGESAGATAVDYLAGYWGAYRAIVERDNNRPESKILEGVRIEGAKMPREMARVMRDVMIFYQQLPFYRELPAADFLRAFFLAQYTPDGDPDLTSEPIRDLMIAATLKYLADPKKVPSFAAWVQTCEDRVKERGGLEALDIFDRRQFSMFLAGREFAWKTKEEPTAPAPRERSPKESAAAVLHRTDEVNVSGTLLTVKAPIGFERLSGRLSSLDDAVNRLAAGAKNEVLILFGTTTDSIAVGQGEFPRMDRTITLQRPLTMPAVVRAAEFLALKNSMRKQLQAGSSLDAPGLYDSMSKAASEAIKKLTDTSSNIRANEPVLLGIFEEDEGSICHSLATRVTLTVAGSTKALIQLTSIALLSIDDRVIAIHANAIMRSPEDLRWTQKAVVEMRDSILKEN